MTDGSAGNGASGAPGDVFTLNEDGTVTIGWGSISSTLRRPTVGEWLSFMEESERANAWADGTPPKKGSEPAKPTVRDAVVGGPYRTLYARILTELGPAPVDVKDLPIWLSLGDPFRRLSNWWVSNPLSQADQAAMSRALSQ